MRKFMSLVLALVMIASVAVVAVSAAGAGTATVTVTDLKGENPVTETYAVGDTFTVTTYLDASEANSGRIGAFAAIQYYNASALEITDEWDPKALGSFADLVGMFPVTKNKTVSNGSVTGEVNYNASVASNSGFDFNGEKVLVVTHYKVIAPGETEIKNEFTTLAVSDYTLTRLVNSGKIDESKGRFSSRVTLSAPSLPIPSGSTVSGSITSYLDEAGEVTVELLSGEEVAYSTTVTGNTVDYSIADVADGSYTLRVSKKNHVARDYDVTVAGDTQQDAKICPIGDVNNDGEIKLNDYALANAHARNKNLITDPYRIACGDTVSNDGEIKLADAARINAHYRNKKSLWS